MYVQYTYAALEYYFSREKRETHQHTKFKSENINSFRVKLTATLTTR